MSDISQDGTAFATFRVSGDGIEPSVITDALGLRPSLSYRKGEIYKAGRHRQRSYKGLTGVWYLSTDTLLTTPDLEEHLALLTFLLAARPRGLKFLHEMVLNEDCEASASCFWSGSGDAAEPDILPAFRDVMDRIGARIELDFMHDVETTSRADVA